MHTQLTHASILPAVTRSWQSAQTRPTLVFLNDAQCYDREKLTVPRKELSHVYELE